MSDHNLCSICGGYLFNGQPCEKCQKEKSELASVPGSPTDAQRLAHLEMMFLECPHAEIFFNDDPDTGEPVGWTIRISGCETSEVTAATFPEVIDLSIVVEKQEKAYNDHLADLADAASY